MRNKHPVTELKWDTDLFKRKIGRLLMRSDYMKSISSITDGARAEGFEYLTCRIDPPDFSMARSLLSAGFYLTDAGVTLQMRVKELLKNDLPLKLIINRADTDDLPGLKKLTRALFLHSRFYHDPFFRKAEADMLYMAWVQDAVKGISADAVFFVKDKGFIVCRKMESNSGDIALIGVKKEYRDKGIGRSLLIAAMNWFKSQGIKTVTVRTQLSNISSINFYLKTGFKMHGCDLVFGMIL